MQRISSKKLIQYFFTALFILAVVFFDGKGEIFNSYDKNFEKNYYFDNCRLPGLGDMGINAATSTTFHVVQVSDGDTIIISSECQPITVRLIGIDTPETVDPRKPVQCYGKEASNFTKQALQGKDVLIEQDPTQDTYDKYGRLLGYVILPDGTNFNKLLVEQGYAHEYTYGKAYIYQKEFKQAESDAKLNQMGLWNPEKCN